MPYPSTIPHIYDDCKKLTIADLKKWNYLKKDNYKSGGIQWTTDGRPSGSIGVKLEYLTSQPIMKLSYNYGDEEVDYSVNLISVPSNLGIGRIWHFLCPFTYKRCRTLYLAAGRFAHRSLCDGFYDSQVQSRRNRSLILIHSLYQKQEDAYSEIYSKGFRTTYNGKPTKRYTKLLKCINMQPIMSLEQLYTMYI